MADLRLAGVAVRGIAEQIGRSPSTVSRELRRNGPAPDGLGKYSPYAAQKRAELRGRRPKASKFCHLSNYMAGFVLIKWRVLFELSGGVHGR